MDPRVLEPGIAIKVARSIILGSPLKGGALVCKVDRVAKSRLEIWRLDLELLNRPPYQPMAVGMSWVQGERSELRYVLASS